eukprot:757383-Hanusia_phi.AAC.2
MPLPPPVASLLDIEKKNPHCHALYTLTFCCRAVRTHTCRFTAGAPVAMSLRSSESREGLGSG